LHKFLPVESYFYFDAKNLSETSRIREFISGDNYCNRLKSLEEARGLILNEYNLMSLLDKELNND